MAKEILNKHTTLFESIKELDENGHEYWGARKLSKVLEYSEFRHFVPVIKRAKEACANSGHSVSDHFEDYLEEIVHGKGAKQDEIQENEYNLNIPRYVDTFEEEAEMDIAAVQQEIEKSENELKIVQGEMYIQLKQLNAI
jgi:type I restriction-modification system DNA methylase subunit